MISETAFAAHYTSIWKILAPTSEIFVRKINSHLYERIFPAKTSLVTANRRALINEAAFTLFVHFVSKINKSRKPPKRKLTGEEIDECFVTARRFIARLDKAGINEIADLDFIEREEALEQTSRLVTFFLDVLGKKPISCYPHFNGCGILDSCNGDIIVGNTLYEVKAGERKFRSLDVRQLLIYAALNSESGENDIQNLGLFNPRIGVSVEVSLNELCFEVSGRAPSDLLADIVQAISSGEMSR